MKVYRAHRLKLYPSTAQRQAMARHAGACRWLWNYMLALQKGTYERDGKFVFSHDMSKILPGLKKQHSWLSDAPSSSLVQVCVYLDRALKDSFQSGKGFQAIWVVSPDWLTRAKLQVSFHTTRCPTQYRGTAIKKHLSWLPAWQNSPASLSSSGQQTRQ